jgi:hypothetical protein
MTPPSRKIRLTRKSVAAISIDISLLVGRDIIVYTEQFPGRELKTRVVAAHDRQISVDAGSNFDWIGNLVNNQTTIVQFPYKGQEVSVKATFRRSVGGRCFFLMGDEVTPLSQRRFCRVKMKCEVRLAPFPLATHSRKNLASLRWMATSSVNISSGGMMVTVPSFLEKDVYLLLNIELEDELFPPLILGQVRHCFQLDNGQFQIGIEFIVQELGNKLFSPARRQELPTSLFRYTRLQRDKLNRKLEAMQTTNESQ